ncbi:hypothetical protein [Micrococcus luteus]|uniref:hypothetical protein n=1 Tax=Micrococcus luteus TaxID=1270 RepID=UPI003330431D
MTAPARPEIVTEYAVRYTGYRHGQLAEVISRNPHHPTNGIAALAATQEQRRWQTDHRIAADAELVTRTITTTPWQPDQDEATAFVMSVRLPRPMLEVLIPDGATLETAWAACIGDREQVGTHDGRPAYGNITRWDLVQVLPDQDTATRFGERLGQASIGDAHTDQWNWYPATDDGDDPALELWGVVDGNEVRPEVAIAPLTALLLEAGEE